jgi:hypothetical protein
MRRAGGRSRAASVPRPHRLALDPLPSLGARQSTGTPSAVNRAIREIGQRSGELNAAAGAIARRLKESESRAARWVGGGGLCERTSAKIAQPVARREGIARDAP